jgi:YHS domain-containing protein
MVRLRCHDLIQKIIHSYHNYFVITLAYKIIYMKFSQILFISLTGLVLSSCGNTFKGETKSLAPAPKKTIDIPVASLAIKADPVCGMNLKQGEIGDTANYQGKTYGFCSTGCKEEFTKTPNQYLTQQ